MQFAGKMFVVNVIIFLWGGKVAHSFQVRPDWLARFSFFTINGFFTRFETPLSHISFRSEDFTSSAILSERCLARARACAYIWGWGRRRRAGGAGFGRGWGGDKKSYGVMAVDGGKHLRSAKWQHTEIVLGGDKKKIWYLQWSHNLADSIFNPLISVSGMWSQNRAPINRRGCGHIIYMCWSCLLWLEIV